MATQKLIDYILGLPEDAAPSADDLILTVNAPGGTPANKKVTLANLATFIGTVIDVSGPIATHAALQTGVHGLAITAGKTLTVQDNVTITGALGTGAYATIGNYAPLASPTFTTIVNIQNGVNAQKLNIYTSYTDPTNYERFAINTAAGTITLAAETLGTGTDNIDIAITPVGTGLLTVSKDAPNSGFTGIKIIDTDFTGFPVLLGGLKANDSSYYLPGLWAGSFANAPSFSNYAFMFDESSGGSIFNGPSTVNPISFRINNTEKMKILTDGTITFSAANGAYGLIKSKQELVTTTAAGTATTAADFIPDGAIPIAISTYVQTAITVPSLTGYQVGDGTDPDRWGDITGHAVGTYSNNANWTATTVQAFVAAQAITLTSVGANFPAGGKIRVCMTYISGSQPTS